MLLRPTLMSFKATGFPLLHASKRRGIWRTNLPWNDRRSRTELLILITIWLLWRTKHRQSCCTMSQRSDSLLMAIQRWQRLRRIVVSPFDQFLVLIERCIGTKSSPLKPNTPTIIACPSGWRDSTTHLHHFTSKDCSSAGTSSITSACGTVTNSRHG